MLIAGFGQSIGRIAIQVVDYLVAHTDCERFGRIHFFGLPPGVEVEDGGRIEPAAVDLWVSRKPKGLVILSCRAQPQDDSACEMADVVLSLAAGLGVRRIFTTASHFPEKMLEVGRRPVFVASTEAGFMKGYSGTGVRRARLRPGSSITGMNGILPGWAGLHSMEGTIVMADTFGYFLDAGDVSASASALRVLNRTLSLGLDLSDIFAAGRKVDSELLGTLAGLPGQVPGVEGTGGEHTPGYL